MATTSTYEAANGMTLPGPKATEISAKPRLRDQERALTAAIRAFDESTCKSRSVTTVAFFVSAALAATMQESTGTSMLGMLALSLVNAGLSAPLARLQFRLEIERRARAEGFTKSISQQIAAEMLADWSNSPNRWVAPAVAQD